MEKLEPKDFILCQDSGIVLQASEPWTIDKPVNFMWIPAGVTTICAHYAGKAIELTVNVTSMTAKAVQASYEDWFRYRPRSTPFGCIEHREQEAALRLPKDVAAFEWKEAAGDRDAGVYCTAVPTGLGAKNVTERIHESWSPSFTTDADYARAKTVKSASGKDFLIFPKGVRGSRENPAEVTGCAFSVGSLTNKPAFRNISPVRAVAEEAYEATEEASVQATWSDAAREAAREAIKTHRHFYEDHEAKARAHSRSENAYATTINAYDEGTSEAHSQAAYAHQQAGESHRSSRLLGKYHGEQAMAHLNHASEHLKQAAKLATTKASEAPANLPAVYASLSPKEEDLKAIYAKLSEPRSPLQDIYDRLEAGEHAEPAGRQ